MDFVEGDVGSALLHLKEQGMTRVDAVVLDPPRKGCRPETLELLRREQPAQVIYISCHPATMARDLNVLCSAGVFELVRVVPLDMFPQTQHVECVADLRAASRAP